ncbi:hypothetical protein EAG_03586 [Camponotus floridanus]|uniref:Uncharacterized protein n=1 Tax=Camponotus floridanus TaxID=104421 RepID=E2ANY4_CAMFO|nr:hypothetical protein EAG_03586 [Camponotus floridanus]
MCVSTLHTTPVHVVQKGREWDPAVARARRLRLDNTESKRATVALIPCSGSAHGCRDESRAGWSRAEPEYKREIDE